MLAPNPRATTQHAGSTLTSRAVDSLLCEGLASPNCAATSVSSATVPTTGACQGSVRQKAERCKRRQAGRQPGINTCKHGRSTACAFDCRHRWVQACAFICMRHQLQASSCRCCWVVICVLLRRLHRLAFPRLGTRRTTHLLHMVRKRVFVAAVCCQRILHWVMDMCRLECKGAASPEDKAAEGRRSQRQLWPWNPFRSTHLPVFPEQSEASQPLFLSAGTNTVL